MEEEEARLSLEQSPVFNRHLRSCRVFSHAPDRAALLTPACLHTALAVRSSLFFFLLSSPSCHLDNPDLITHSPSTPKNS